MKETFGRKHKHLSKEHFIFLYPGTPVWDNILFNISAKLFWPQRNFLVYKNLNLRYNTGINN